MKSKRILLLVIVIAFIFIGISDLAAQCPMCRMSAESNLQHGGTMGRGLNSGILYILSLPYLIVLTLGIVWYRNKKKNSVEEEFDLE